MGRSTGSSRLGLTALIVAASCLGACYDSRWGAEERSQKVIAQHATPSELHGTEDTAAETAPLQVQRVRAYVTPSYAAQVSNERKQIERMFDDVNEVLGPTLRLQLELSDVRRWSSANDGDIALALEELAAMDGGDDVDWVVGFVGRPPILEHTFTELGRARMHGRHFVLRAMNDAAEYDYLQKALDELDEAERSKLHRRRVEHKEVAVFLHELGHTLGVPHEVDDATLMNARYNHEADGFSEDAAVLMRMSLKQRLEPRAMSERQLARSMMARLKSTSANWVADERDEALARLEPIAGDGAPSAPPEGFDAQRWLALDEGERAALRLALQNERDGNLQQAWSYAEALFAAHPEGYEVQDLRCRLALRLGGPVDQVQAHCADFTRLEERARSPR